MYFETHMFADAVISFLHDGRGAQAVLLIAPDTKVTKKITRYVRFAELSPGCLTTLPLDQLKGPGSSIRDA